MKRSHPARSVLAPRALVGKTVGVVGLGHIGGSMVKRLSRFAPQITVLGTDSKLAVARQARRYCKCLASLNEIVERSDILVLAVHMPQILELMPLVAAGASKRTSKDRLLVTDTGTNKLPVARLARRFSKAFDFVGLHPLAGSERSGWEGADPDLFEGCTAVYCPEPGGARPRLLIELIRLLGAKPMQMRADVHDRCVGLTIGLPHALAYAAQGLSQGHPVPSALKSSSWSSLTRVAASDPAMVAGFLQTNATAVTGAAKQLIRRLDRLVAALRDSDGKTVEALLRRWQRDTAR